MAWEKPHPVIDEDNALFWEAAKRHEFALFHCKICGAWYWPKAFCRNHKNEPMFGNMEWAKASGKGKVFSLTIHNVPFHPGFKNDVPYAFALIETDEGPIFGTRVVGIDPYKVKIGMPVEVCFEDVIEEGFALPYFKPIKD